MSDETRQIPMGDLAAWDCVRTVEGHRMTVTGVTHPDDREPDGSMMIWGVCQGRQRRIIANSVDTVEVYS